MANHLSSYEGENLLVGGDFNLYIDPKINKLDSMSNKNDNPTYRSDLISLLDSLNLEDAWRNFLPIACCYTWHARGKASRLDYFFISSHLLNDLTKFNILPGLFSDHSILYIAFNNHKDQRGREYWKFNANLLHDTNYVNNIKSIIHNCKGELCNYSDKGLVWEVTKLKIRNFTIPYCIKRKKEKNIIKQNLDFELETLLAQLDENNTLDSNNIYIKKKNKN